MKTSKVLLIVLLILFPLTKSLAQKGTFAVADKEYNLLRYKTAILHYLKGLQTDSLNQRSIERLANSYHNIKDYKNAEIWYGKAVSLSPGNPDINLHYAEVLASNGKYEASGMWYQKYLTLNKDDTRASVFAKAYVDISEFYTDSAKWKVRFTSLNTGFDEFAPVFFKKGLIITSNRSPAKIKYISGRDMKPFTDLYFISDTNSIKPIDVKGQTSKQQDMTAMIGGNDIPTTINDNRALGNFNIKSLSGITEYDYEGGFTPATLLKGDLQSKLNDGPVSFPADESWMMFTRNNKYNKAERLNRDDVNKLQLFSARYANGKWGNIESFPYNSNKYSTGHPALSADGNILYFVSDMPGGHGGTDLYYCVRTGFSWTKPVNLGNKVNTEGDEMFPSLDRQGNLYFSSTGLPGLGGLDIFYVPTKEYLPSVQAKNLGYPVNSSKDDFGIITNPNGLSGYFSSNRKGNDDIYRFDHDPMAKAGETVAKAELVKPKTEPVRAAVQPVKPVAEPVKPATEPVRAAAQPVKPVAESVNGTRISLAENIIEVTTVSASDEDAGTTFSYSLSGGLDMAKFRINSSSGALTFISATDYEKPTDSDANNTYITMVRVSDGTNITDLTTIVTITDVNDNAPVIISNATVSIPENISAVTTIMATDTDAGTTFSYSLSGGADVAKFLVNSSSGILSFISAPDFERPADAGTNNTYIAVVRASDGTNTTDQTVIVSVTGVNDNAPVIISNASVSVPENNTVVTTVRTTDADAGATFSYSLSGGTDVAKFSINSSNGALTFVSAPDFERPADVDANNTYIAVVRVSDGTITSNQTVVITVTDVNDNAPLITSNAVVSVPENTTEVTTVKATDTDAGSTFTYSLSGGADVVKFRINSSTGTLAFISAPDLEKPADAGANNTYTAVVRASDGTKTSDQTIVVSVTDVNDNAPVITSNAIVSISENTTDIITVRATDADAGTTFSYSLSGGADAAKFYINSSSGALIFISAPDYEKPSDADANNKYIVVIRASDGANTVDQTLTITITDINDNAPVIKL